MIHVDQSPIGRTPRSNPATYTGVFDHIRKLFASTPEAKMRGYLQGRFSFNVKGGRCEACAGDGTIKIEMNFLPDVYVPCEVCHGARYNRETLEVHYKGKTIAEVLDMPIEEAVDFFAAVPPIARHMKTLVEVGLGYVRLGPAGHDAVRRRGAAGQAVLRAPEAVDRAAPSTCSTSRRPACTSRTSASCCWCSAGWSTRATRCWSSSTTSTSSRPPTGSSTWDPRAAPAAARSSPRAPRRPWRPTPASYTGQFLKPILEGREATPARSRPAKAAAKKTAAQEGPGQEGVDAARSA